MDSIKESSNSPFRAIHFRLIQTVAVVGLILSIVGGTSSFSSDGTYIAKPMSKVAIILYIVAYAAEVLIALHTLFLSQSHHGEKLIIYAVIAALPLILIRLIYSALGVIAHSHTFSMFNGSVAAFAIMAVVMEIIVIAVYLAAGWKSEKVRKTSNSEPDTYHPLFFSSQNSPKYAIIEWFIPGKFACTAANISI